MSLLISSSQGILLNETVFFPINGQDFNIVLKKPIDNATSLRLTFTKDNSSSPGLAEIQVIGRR